MSVLDSRVIFIKEDEFNNILTGTPGVVYKIKDKVNQPEFIWDGLKFVTNITYPKGNIIDLEGLIVQNASFGVANNYSRFDEDGVMVAENDAATWVDVDFPIIIRSTGPNIPVLSAIQGNVTAPQWAVSDFSVCEGQELIHGWKEGSPIQWHVHILTNGTDTTDRFLRFELEWVYADIMGNLSSTIITTSTDFFNPR